MNPFLQGVEAATADSEVEVQAAFERLKIASVAAERDAAREGANIHAAITATGIAPSCSVDVKTGQPTFINFDPQANAVKTIALLEQEKANLDKRPGSKSNSKKIRVLASLISHFSASLHSPEIEIANLRKDNRIKKQMRRKAARADLERKQGCAELAKPYNTELSGHGEKSGPTQRKSKGIN
jgi:hypothetical protein